MIFRLSHLPLHTRGFLERCLLRSEYRPDLLEGIIKPADVSKIVKLAWEYSKNQEDGLNNLRKNIRRENYCGR